MKEVKSRGELRDEVGNDLWKRMERWRICRCVCRGASVEEKGSRTETTRDLSVPF